MIAPIPIDSVKNACPMAASTLSQVSLLKSGVNMNARPSPKWPDVNEYPSSTSMSNRSAGTMKRTACSSPRSTPRMTTKIVKAINRVWQNATARQLPTKLPN